MTTYKSPDKGIEGPVNENSEWFCLWRVVYFLETGESLTAPKAFEALLRNRKLAE